MTMRFLLLSILVSLPAFAQNLMEERIWKVADRKKSIFLDSGVFHYAQGAKGASISGIRNSAVDGRGYERVVIDFNTPTVPRLYGHLGGEKISVDFFETTAGTSQSQIKNSKYVKSVDFISVDGKALTMELTMKGKSSYDVFYLENPGRLVIDIR